MACSSVTCKTGDHHEHEARCFLAQPHLFSARAEVPPDLTFTTPRRFSFTSPVTSRWPSNNRVYGKLFRPGNNWRQRPAVILLHGWNSELCYEREFPFLAWRLNRHALNAAMIQLPFHGRRRPTNPGAINNFISHDLLSMLEATRQALADTEAMALWLLEQGCPMVGVWGISLGAWLAGLLLCQNSRLAFGVLMTPVPNVEIAIRELDFCAPIRQALEAKSVDLTRLNLSSLKPLIPPEDILIIEAQHDLFAPVPIVEELWKQWNQPPIWRVPHGHIGLLLSLPLMERTVGWVSAAPGRIRLRDYQSDRL